MVFRNLLEIGPLRIFEIWLKFGQSLTLNNLRSIKGTSMNLSEVIVNQL